MQVAGVTVINDASGFGFKQFRNLTIEDVRTASSFIQVRAALFPLYDCFRCVTSRVDTLSFLTVFLKSPPFLHPSKGSEKREKTV